VRVTLGRTMPAGCKYEGEIFEYFYLDNSIDVTAHKKKLLQTGQATELLEILRQRFEKNMSRHPGLKWEQVHSRLEADQEGLWSLNEMEISGGEPDVVNVTSTKGEILFIDCSTESPKGRRSICYDQQALNSRKENKPANSAMNMAITMGIDLLTQEQYRQLQEFGNFDLKTSSWILTPDKIRNLGGALFCDRRYDHVFLYHNGAESYYAARGFRGILKIW
jgi:hypothetical protein